jgi:hypothetical protein
MDNNRHMNGNRGAPDAAASSSPPSMSIFQRFYYLSSKEKLVVVVAILLFVLFVWNMLFKDYNAETKSYLTSVGRKDAIDKVIPKTYESVAKERAQKELIFQQLVQNVTSLTNEVKSLRTEITKLKAHGGNA